MKLTFKLILRILLPALLIVIGTGAFNRYMGYSTAKYNATNQLQMEAELGAELLERELNAIRLLISGVLSRESLSDYGMFKRAGLLDDAEESRQQLETSLARLVQQHHEYNRIELYDSSGKRFVAIHDGKRVLKPSDISNEVWFQNAGIQGSFVSRVGDDLARVTVSQCTDESEVCMYGSLVFDFAHVAEPVLAFATKGARESLVDITCRKGIHLLGEKILSEDVQYISTSHPVPSIGGKITLSQPMSVAMAEFRQLEVIMGLTLSGVLITLLLSLWFGMKQTILAPVRRILEIIRAYESDQQLPEPSNKPVRDELGTLNQTLRKSLEGWRHSQKNLQELNVELEEKVARRTIELTENELRTSGILDATADAIITIDERGIVGTFNAAAQETFGYSYKEVVGRNVSMLMPELHAIEHDAFINRYVSGGDAHVVGIEREVEAMRKDGSLFPCILRVTELDIYDNRLFIGTLQDITERKEAEEKLRHSALHDSLTGLANRRLLLDRLNQHLQLSQRNPDRRFAVLFLDFDGFKIVNDSLGHDVGDELLIGIAERLHDCLRVTDTLATTDDGDVARIGGDEFVILLEDIHGVEDAVIVADRIKEAMSEPFHIADQEVFTSASIGIASSETGYENADDILRDADTAMYHAKENGKARYQIFDEQMHVKALQRLRFENDLHLAIEDDQFLLNYQPLVDLSTNQVTGFEALIRWQHPELGLISPLDFIPLSEETGLIIPIGLWVMKTACKQLAIWQERFSSYENLSMNINISKRQICEPSFVEDVRKVIAETGVSPQDIRLEITETVIMENADTINDVLEALKSLGVQLHMDDFGTGYSSLSYLHLFPIDVLKIDRSFTSNLGSNVQYAAVVHAIVTLAHNLKMKVTAEGIETSDQLIQIIDMDCDQGQGMFFAAPLGIDDAEILLSKNVTFEFDKRAA